MLHGRMGGMRTVPQGIQEQYVQPAQQLHRFRGNVAVVGQICGATKAKSIHRAFAVTKPYGCEVEPEKIDRAAVKSVRDQARHGGFRVAGIEDVAETVPDVCNGLRRAVNGNLAALPEIKRPYIVQAHDIDRKSTRLNSSHL